MEDTSTDDISLDSLLDGNSSNPTPTPTNNPKPEDTPSSDDKGSDLKPEDTPNPSSSDDEGKVNEQEFKTLISSFTSEDNLEEEDKVLRKELLAKYKGNGFDVNGNVVDAEGNIKASFDDVLKGVNEEDVTLDSQGNQVNSEGEIVKTAYEIAVENTVVNKLASETGYKLVDENGQPKIYSDDDEGFKELTNDLSAQRFKEFKSEFFSQHPVLTEVAKHLLSGNTLDTFQQAVDYTNIDVTKISDAEKEQHIRRSLEVKGIDTKQIDTMVQLIKDSNSLTDQAAIALPALQAYEDSRVSNRDLEYQQTIEQQQKEVEEYWNKANDIISKGKLSKIDIPDADKNDFYDYISTAVDDKGNSKEALDIAKETLEDRLAYSYLRFKGFDLQKLVKSEVKKEKALSLRERIKRSKQTKDSPLNDANVGVTSGEADITLSSLLP